MTDLEEQIFDIEMVVRRRRHLRDPYYSMIDFWFVMFKLNLTNIKTFPYENHSSWDKLFSKIKPTLIRRIKELMRRLRAS